MRWLVHWPLMGGLLHLRAAAPPSPLLAVPNVTVHPSTANVPTSYNLMCPLDSKGLIIHGEPCRYMSGISGTCCPSTTHCPYREASSDEKIHEFFCSDIFHEILHEIFLKYFKNFTILFFRLYTHPFNISLYVRHYLSFIYAYCSSLSLSACLYLLV